MQFVQKTYKNGADIAKSLEAEAKKDLTSQGPTRQVSSETDEGARKIEQEGFDILYHVEVEQHHKHLMQLKENVTKSYALIYSNYCSRTIQLVLRSILTMIQELKMIPLNSSRQSGSSCMTQQGRSILSLC